jgi:hypothetical protein
MNLDSTAGGPSAEDLEAKLAEVLPGWYEPVTIALAAISVLAMLAAIILLSLPASNAYFRRARPTWDPSLPYPYPYPGQQPSYPGQPWYPGQPQAYPPYPGQEQPPQGYQPPDSTTPPPPTPPPSSAPPAGDTPHTGSVPPTDPWSAPPVEDRPADRPTSGDDRPPSGPTAHG